MKVIYFESGDKFLVDERGVYKRIPPKRIHPIFKRFYKLSFQEEKEKAYKKKKKKVPPYSVGFGRSTPVKGDSTTG
jgi:hypothetical protein